MEKLACFLVVKPQGIKGELKAKILADNFDSVKSIKKLYDESGKEYTLSKVKDAFGGFAFLSIKNIVTRNDAELYRNFLYYAEKSSINKAKNDFFISDLIGLEVVVSGDSIGRVCDVIKSNVDMFDIDLFSGKKAYFPFLNSLEIKVDLSAKKLRIEKDKLDGVIFYED